MQTEIFQALSESELKEASPAIALLQSDGMIEIDGSDVSCGELFEIYAVRLRLIRRFPALHAHRLAEAITEFLSNLERHRSGVGKWVTIRGSQELHFSIFLVNGCELLGCPPVVSKLEVSPERWDELWGSNER